MELNLSYSPVSVIDTKGMKEEDWLKLREHGRDWDNPLSPMYIEYTIGGSTLASILNVSPWTTKFETWMIKQGYSMNGKQINPEAKLAGHVYEDFVAQMFTHMHGYKADIVVEDTMFYQHPFFPFAVANIDRRVIHNGVEGVLEIKTTSYRNYDTIQKWKSGICPIYYEYQCRWYMSILNLPYTYIICAWGFTTNDMAVIRIDRDLEIEKFLIEESMFFIESLKKGEKPSILDTSSKMAVEALDRVYGKRENKEIEFPEHFERYLVRLNVLNEEKAQLKKIQKDDLDDIESQILTLSKPILEYLAENDTGYLVLKDGTKIVINNPTKQTRTIDSSKVKDFIAIEDLDKVYKISENRKMKIEVIKS